MDAFIYDSSVEMRTCRDRYDLLTNFSNFLIGENHLAVRLTEGFDRPKVTDAGEVSSLTVDHCQRLLDVAATEPCGREGIRGAMLPYFANCMLSRLRLCEARRMPPDWRNFSFENRVIVGFRAKRNQRHVTKHDELPGTLQQCKEAGLAPGFFSRKAFERMQVVAGVKIPAAAEPEGEAESNPTDADDQDWDNDILRHSYASHFHARHPDLDTLVRNMGNSEAVLFASYLNRTVLKSAGEAYFTMKPRDLSQLGTKAPRGPRAAARAKMAGTDE